MTKIDGIREILRKKGWPQKEIERAADIIESEAEKRSHAEFRRSSNRVLYWMVIMILITVNILVAVVLIPFLLVLKGLIFYVVVACLALIFGLIFNFLISDIEYLDKRYHLIAAILIPLVALVNIFVIVGVSNRIDEILNIQVHNSPAAAGLVYVAVFMAPYLLSGAWFRKK